LPEIRSSQSFVPSFEAPRGTHDILPSEQPAWQFVKQEFEELCALYGYRRIDTPVFEDTELFARTSGQGSDVVTKEMYTFEDRGGRSLTLRPEPTAGIVRAYLEHGLHREPQPQKLFAIAPQYRYGRPQKGRYREFWQLDVEAIGSDDPATDAEVIQLYGALLGRLGITDFQLELNSIGDPNCRPAYLEERLKPWLAEHATDLDEATREQASRNPLRALDNLAAKPPAVQEVLRQAPALGDSLCEACREHFAEVRRYLDAFGVSYELVPTLVRGLDYYTRTTWEFVGPESGSQSVLSGGGRYDGLAEELGGPRTPGVGFGAGIERLLIALEGAGTTMPADEGIDVFFVCGEGADRPAVLAKLMELRAAGIRADADFAGRSVKGQHTQAGRLGAKKVVVVDAGTDLAAVTA
jgi:histidyl-tRNA synthetase